MACIIKDVNRILPSLTRDIFSNQGKHNDFVVVVDTEGHYPGRVDPIILRYTDEKKRWIFVADKTITDFKYVNETIALTGISVALKHIPLNHIVWDAFIIDQRGNKHPVDVSKLDIRNNILLNVPRHSERDLLDIKYAIGDGANIYNNIISDNKDFNAFETRPPVGSMFRYDPLYIEIPDDCPSDINDIDARHYCNGEQVRNRRLPGGKKAYNKDNVADALNTISDSMINLKNKKLFTTERTKIVSGRFKLPSTAYGDVLYNMALIFNSDDIVNDLLVREAQCRVEDDYVIFDNVDEMENLYAVVTYLTDAE